MSTPNGTQLQIATDSGFTTKQVDYSGDYTTDYNIAANVLPRNTQLYARVRHSTVEAGYTPWSTSRMFTIAQYSKWVSCLSGSSVGGNNIVSVVSPDNNYIYCGGNRNNYNYSPVHRNMSFTKYDTDGNAVWSRYLEGTYGNFSGAVISPDGNYIYMIGHNYPSGSSTGCIQIFLLKFDSNGNVIWQKTIDNSFVPQDSTVGDTGYGITLLGSYLYAVGYIRTSTSTVYRDAYIIKLNTDGVMSWIKCVNGSNRTEFYDVKVSPDGNYLYCVGDDYPSQIYAMIMKFDLATLSLVWSKTVTGSASNYNCIFRKMAFSPDGNYLYLAGYCYLSTGNVTRNYVVKYDKDGNKIWERYIENIDAYDNEYETVNVFYGIAVDSAGYIYATGYYNINNTYITGIILKLDSSGNRIWCRQLSQANHYIIQFQDVVCASDGNVYVTGIININGSQGYQSICAVIAGGPNIGMLPEITGLSWIDNSGGVVSNTATEGSNAFPLVDYTATFSLSDTTFVNTIANETLVRSYY